MRSLNAQLAEYKKTQRDAMIEHIRYEIEKREIVDEHFDAMAARRESIAEQSRKHLRDLETLTDSRARLAMSCALADILRDLDELQREVDGWKIDQAPDNEIFERMNDGLFFKHLYGEHPSPSGVAATTVVMRFAATVAAVIVAACVVIA